jgi:hypothetical protein
MLPSGASARGRRSWQRKEIVAEEIAIVSVSLILNVGFARSAYITTAGTPMMPFAI